MFFKKILIDLDNTLYDYSSCHDFSLKNTLNYIENNSEYDYIDLFNIYSESKNIIYNQLINTASSHNKLLSFKYIFDKLNLHSIIDINYVNDFYWQCFFSKMKLYDGVEKFLTLCDQFNIELCVVTDYTLEHQINKLKLLNVYPKYITKIISSEESGFDKPHPLNYILAKQLINEDNNVCMIGDNFKKDIVGANNLGIFSFWFSNQSIDTKMVYQFNSFDHLYTLFLSMNSIIDDLVYLSNKYGQRYDLIQGSGGNISCKYDEFLIIKSSGVKLSDVSVDDGYAILRDCININGKKESIETPFHLFLKKYVVHLHPIQINKITTLNNSEEILKELFPESLIIPYTNPGDELSESIKSKYNKHDIIFLLNHGIIFTNDNLTQLQELIHHVLNICENYNNFDSSIHNTCYDISSICHNIDNKYHVTIHSNIVIEKNNNLFPDKIVYCGSEYLYINELNKNSFENYYDKYNKLPTITIFNNDIFITSKSINKCYDIEKILKGHTECYNDNNIEISDNDIDKLLNRGDESYRANL
jgi:FMN phosphatase YigB (HAD superfamily)/ribulose-5-phosphate 4-epimerase/fuculose-1-phosphate aldolase